MINKLSTILLFLFFSACQSTSSDRLVVARAFDNYLYFDEIPYLDGYSYEDSVISIHNFANQWASKKILLNKAAYNFKNDQLYIDSLVNVYRESLLIHYYKEAVIQNYLDTLITDSLMINYYQDNMENFFLKEDIVKLNYVKIRNVAPNLDFVANKYYSRDFDDIELLEDYCVQFADRFFLGDINWISWDDFLNQIPEKNRKKLKNGRQVLRKNKRFELEDSVYQYFIFVQDFKLKGTSSPLEYVSSIIGKIILNKRKKEILYNIEEELLQEAIKNNKFEIYE
tara:strand:+ start:328 stop:1176 length:849 start_codon:yes stop_codon:yes gene_type:complete